MLEFAKYLKEHFNENIETAEQLIEKKWNKTNYIIKEAFEGRYSNRSTAINKIKNDFTNPNIAPKSIDVDFLKKNLNYVLEKVESLSETDIKIIINTDINKSGKVSSVSTSTSDCDGGCKASFDDVGTIELESVKSKRGRKKKIVAEDMDDDYSNEYNVDNINTDIDSPFKGQLDFSEEPEDAGEEPEDLKMLVKNPKILFMMKLKMLVKNPKILFMMKLKMLVKNPKILLVGKMLWTTKHLMLQIKICLIV